MRENEESALQSYGQGRSTETSNNSNRNRDFIVGRNRGSDIQSQSTDQGSGTFGERTKPSGSRNTFASAIGGSSAAAGSNIQGERRPGLSSNGAQGSDTDYAYDDYDENAGGLNFLNSIGNIDTGGLGVFIREPSFAINQTLEDYDRERENQNRINQGRPSNRGTNILEPEFGIDGDPNGLFSGDQGRRRPSSGNRQRGSGSNDGRTGTDIQEPDFSIEGETIGVTIDKDGNRRPIFSNRGKGGGIDDRRNGINLPEPDFAVDDNNDSNFGSGQRFPSTFRGIDLYLTLYYDFESYLYHKKV